MGSEAMPGGTGLVEDIRRAALFDRQAIAVSLGTIGDDFIRNIVRVLVELRAGSACSVPLHSGPWTSHRQTGRNHGGGAEQVEQLSSSTRQLRPVTPPGGDPGGITRQLPKPAGAGARASRRPRFHRRGSVHQEWIAQDLISRDVACC